LGVEKMKNKILLFVMAIIVVVIGVGIFSLGVFDQTTEIDSRFLGGTIQEKAYKNNENRIPQFRTMYDSNNYNNRYIFGMADSLKIFVEINERIGAKKVATRTYNGIKWEIYVITPQAYYETHYSPAYAYLCVASGKTGDYYIEVASLTLEADETLQSDLFTKYTKPLLESIKFKNPENPPKEHEIIGASEEDYNLVKKYGLDYFDD
jgi:hypothetical protein